MSPQTILQRAVCTAGDVGDAAVRRVASAVLVAWAEACLRGSGRDMLSETLRHCTSLLQVRYKSKHLFLVHGV